MDLQNIFYIEGFDFDMIILPLILANFLVLITVMVGTKNKTTLMRLRDFCLIAVAVWVDIFAAYSYLVWIG